MCLYNIYACNQRKSTRLASFDKMRSELDARLKCDHARGTVAPEAHAQQAGRRRGRVSKCAEAGLRRAIAGDAGHHLRGLAEVGVIEDVEELRVDSQLDALA